MGIRAGTRARYTLAMVAALSIFGAACADDEGDGAKSVPTTDVPVDPARTYSTRAFVVPIDVTVPTWLPDVAPAVDTRNFVTWEPSSASEPAVRILVPLSVFLPGDDTAVEPPADLLGHVLSMEAHGATIADRTDIDIDSHAGTLLTVTSDQPLEGVLGCPAEGLDAGDCYGIQPDLALRLVVFEVDGTSVLAWLRHQGEPDTADAAGDFAAFEAMLADIRFADREPTSEAGTPAGATPLDGVWTMTSTLAELEASPLLQDQDELNDENWGDWTFTFGAGRFTFEQTNSVAQSSASGTFLVDGDRLRLDLDNVEHFEMRWHVDGGELILTPDASIGVAPTPFFLHPWTMADPSVDDEAAGALLMFSRAGDSYGEATLFVADADGANERVLVEYGDVECCPQVTRDGARVVFAVVTPEDQIAPGVINIDGSGYRVFDLPEGGLNLGAGPFTPDGTRIAFEGFHPTDPAADGIYIGSATDGTGLLQVTEQHDIPGDFSPDGSQLVFFRPTPNTDASPLSGSLMIVDVDVLEIHPVTPDGMIVQCCPRWSPDGQQIVFEDPGGSLWLIHPDGSDLIEIFEGGDDKGYAIDAAWSPDGSHIVFSLDSGSDPFAHPTNELIVINADGTGATTVIGTADHKRDIAWFPRT